MRPIGAAPDLYLAGHDGDFAAPICCCCCCSSWLGCESEIAPPRHWPSHVSQLALLLLTTRCVHTCPLPVSKKPNSEWRDATSPLGVLQGFLGLYSSKCMCVRFSSDHAPKISGHWIDHSQSELPSSTLSRVDFLSPTDGLRNVNANDDFFSIFLRGFYKICCFDDDKQTHNGKIK